MRSMWIRYRNNNTYVGGVTFHQDDLDGTCSPARHQAYVGQIDIDVDEISLYGK